MMMPSIFGNNFVDDVFDDMFPFAGGYTTANYDLMNTDVKDAVDHYELEMEIFRSPLSTESFRHCVLNGGS